MYTYRLLQLDMRVYNMASSAVPTDASQVIVQAKTNVDNLSLETIRLKQEAASSSKFRTRWDEALPYSDLFEGQRPNVIGPLLCVGFLKYKWKELDTRGRLA